MGLIGFGTFMLEFLKVIFLGIIEGITEWLPISSTGHMLLVDTFMNLKASQDYKDMFMVVIQLGAILAVVVIYWEKLWPFAKMSTIDAKYHALGLSLNDPLTKEDRRLLGKTWRSKDLIRVKGIAMNRRILQMWVKVIVATIPAAIIGLLLDDFMDAHAHTAWVIAIALIVYGVAFIFVEDRNRTRTPRVTRIGQLTYLDALKMGLFQCLAIVPGTSRSGSTIIGGLICGIDRKLAAEFSFFMSIPVMFGWSVVKLIKFGLHYSFAEFILLLVGMAVAYFVSVFVIKTLMAYIKKHDFKIFGWYRIALGVLVLIVFAIQAIMA